MSMTKQMSFDGVGGTEDQACQDFMLATSPPEVLTYVHGMENWRLESTLEDYRKEYGDNALMEQIQEYVKSRRLW